MSRELVAICLVAGIIYLGLWPVRLFLMQKAGRKPVLPQIFLPILSGAILIVFDFVAVKQLLAEWYMIAIFVHGFLLLFGLAIAMRVVRSTPTGGGD